VATVAPWSATGAAADDVQALHFVAEGATAMTGFDLAAERDVSEHRAHLELERLVGNPLSNTIEYSDARVVRRHGCHVAVSSTLGLGTTVRVALPRG
jgi:hypothetical protein